MAITLKFIRKWNPWYEVEAFVKRYEKRIQEVAQRYTRVHEDAKDVIEQAFQNAFVGLRRRRLGLSVGVIKARLYHASRKLRQALTHCTESSQMRGNEISAPGFTNIQKDWLNGAARS